jgi:hypothetical protein
MRPGGRVDVGAFERGERPPVTKATGGRCVEHRTPREVPVRVYPGLAAIGLYLTFFGGVAWVVGAIRQLTRRTGTRAPGIS